MTTPRKRLLHELLGTIDSNTELPGRPAGGDVGVIAGRVLLPRKRAWKICGRPHVGHASDGDDPHGLAGQKVVPGIREQLARVVGHVVRVRTAVRHPRRTHDGRAEDVVLRQRHEAVPGFGVGLVPRKEGGGRNIAIGHGVAPEHRAFRRQVRVQANLPVQVGRRLREEERIPIARGIRQRVKIDKRFDRRMNPRH